MLTDLSPEVQQKAIDLYRVAGGDYSFNKPLAVLHIAPAYTLLVVGAMPATPDCCWQFAVGNQKIADDFFRHNPPAPGEVENAIVAVEDEIMQVAKLLPVGVRLSSSDSGVEEIYAQLFPYQKSATRILFRSDMEAVFGRLSAIISGRPASSDTLPETMSFVSNLLIVREVMFHLGFDELMLN